MSTAADKRLVAPRSKSSMEIGRLPRLTQSRQADRNKRELASTSTLAMRGLRTSALNETDKTFEVWPANTKSRLPAKQLHDEDDLTPQSLTMASIISRGGKDFGAKPALTRQLEGMISTGLAAVNQHFPEFKHKNNYRRTAPLGGEEEGISWTASGDEIQLNLAQLLEQCREKNASVIESGEDRFAAARFNVFQQAGRAFARSFQTYKPLVLWILEEYERYIAFSLKYVDQERHALSEIKKRALNLSSDIRAENEGLYAEIAELKAAVDAGKEREIALQEEIDGMQEKHKYAMSLERQFERQHSTAEYEKGILTKNIMALEEEVADLKEKLEAPEKVITSLRQQLLDKDESNKRLKDMQEKTLTENAACKRRITLIERRQVEPDVRSMQQEMRKLLRQSQTQAHVVATVQGRLRELTEQTKLAARSAPYNGTNTEGVELTPRPRNEYAMLEGIPSTAGRLAEANRIIEKLQTDLSLVREEQAHLDTVMGPKEPVLTGMRSMLNPAAIGPTRRWFLCEGESKSVLPFLRGVGRARNKKFSRQATKVHICQFFKFRRGNANFHGTVAEHFHEWMDIKYGSEAINMAYSFWHALQWFPHDVDCVLFRKLLEGSISVKVWDDGYTLVNELKQEFAERCAEIGAAKLPKLTLSAMMARYFSVWEEDMVGYLIQTIAYSLLDDAIDPNRLFQATADESDAPFVHAVRSLAHIDRERFLMDLEVSLLEDPAVASGEVTVQGFANALHRIDPLRPLTSIDEFLQCIFGYDTIELALRHVDQEVPFHDRYSICGTTMYLQECLNLCALQSIQRHCRRSKALEIMSSPEMAAVALKELMNMRPQSR